MKYVTALLGMLVVSVSALAANVDGTWKGMVSTPKGDYPISFSFKVEEGRLQGTMLGTDGTPFKIEEGKLDGNTITFSVTLNYPGKTLARTYKGVISGEEIRFTQDYSGQQSEFIVKRVN
jgi:hypothetical protein